MLTRLIVALYANLVEVALWLTLALAMGIGYNFAVPLMRAAGAAPMPEFAWKVLGAAAFLIITFLLLAVIIGPVLLLLDVRRAVRSIEAKLDRGEEVRPSLRSQREEPSI